MKDHKIAELVNQIRAELEPICANQSLRARISKVVTDFFQPDGSPLIQSTDYPDVVPLDDCWITRIPDDNYKLETSLVKCRQSTPDSLAGGHWIWQKITMGYRGETTGVLLSLDWAEALEFQG